MTKRLVVLLEIAVRADLLCILLLSILGLAINPEYGYAQVTEPEKVDMNASKVYNTISGYVRTKETNEAVVYAPIVVKYSDHQVSATTTDFNGFFSMRINTSLYNIDSLNMIYSFVDFKQDTVRLADMYNRFGNEKFVLFLESKIKVLDSVEVYHFIFYDK